MSVLNDNNRGLDVRHRMHRRRLEFSAWFVCSLVLSIVFLVGSTVAMRPDPVKGGRSARGAKRAQPARATAKAQPGNAGTCGASAQESTRGVKEAPAGKPVRIGGNAPPKSDAGAKWVCPETTVTIPPIWRGEQIECPFMIRNEGTAKLEIKARGG